METIKYQISPAHSEIKWVGRKVTGAHNGTIGIKEGTIVLQDGMLTGGHFVADTSSIKILDIADPLTNAQFAGHLASDDFFSTAQYPDALLNITTVQPDGKDTYSVNANLTIRGMTHPVQFSALLNANNKTLAASGTITVDRTKYGMKFRSGNFFKDLGDVLIYDEFNLNFNISAFVA